MSVPSISEILGCRNGIAVVKKTVFYQDGCEEVTYSDGLDDTDFIPGPCANPSAGKTAQITCVEENDNIYILKYDIADDTWKVYDISTNPATDVTGTVTPITCAKSELYDIVSAGDFCDNGIDLSRYDVVDVSTQLPVGSYFTDNLGAIVTPTGTPTKGKCGLAETYIVTITPRCYDTGAGSIQVVGFERRLSSDNTVLYREYEVILSTDITYTVGDIITDITSLTQIACVSCSC